MSNLSTLAEEEKARIKSILDEAEVSEKRKNMLEPIIENTAWMKIKLDEAREAIKSSNVVIPYDNGGGQTGIRENPLFKGYESLWKSYMTGMQKILDCLPADKVAREVEETHPQTVLQLVRDRRKKEA